MPVSIEETSGSNLSNHQVRIDISYLAGMNADFSDIRFTANDGTSLLDYWIEYSTPGVNAIVWVEIPSLPSLSTSEIYLYYCNPAAGTDSNGLATFVFFDHFDSWSGWNNYGPGAVQQDNTSNPGISTLAKITTCDPNGGFKLMGSTLSEFRMITREIRLNEGGSSCSWNRYGIENSSYNGYNIRRNADFNQNNKQFGYERRTGGSASNTNNSNMNHPRNIWYRIELKRCAANSNNLSASLYSDDRTEIGTVTGTDTQYNSFDRVTIRGGRPYYMDFIAVANYTCSDPTYSFGTLEKDLPVAICQNATIQLNDLGQASLSTALIDNNSYDECGPISLSLNQSSFNCTHLGGNLVVLTVTDQHNNTATCTANVTVEDLTPPVIDCPADIVIDANANDCSAIVSWTDPVITDNCSVGEISSSHNSGDQFPEGTTIVSYKVTDASGNSSSCSFSVTVNNGLPAPGISISDNSGLTPNDGILCAGDEATLTATAGYSSYSWSNGDLSQSTTVNSADTYTVIVTDAIGCSNSSSTDIIVNNLPQAGTCNIVHDLCQKNEGQITVEASSGLAPYLVEWTPNVGTTTSPSISNSGGQMSITAIPGNTTISISVTDANGCVID